MLWCGDFWLSWQLWPLINSTPGSSAMESGPEDKSGTKCIRKTLKTLSPLCSSYTPRSSSPHTHATHCAIGCFSEKDNPGWNTCFLLHLPALQKVEFSVFVNCTQTRDSLNCTIGKQSSLTRLKHLTESQSVKNALEQHLSEILSTITLLKKCGIYVLGLLYVKLTPALHCGG